MTKFASLGNCIGYCLKSVLFYAVSKMCPCLKNVLFFYLSKKCPKMLSLKCVHLKCVGLKCVPLKNVAVPNKPPQRPTSLKLF